MAEMTLMDKIVSLCKRRGFIFPDSELYGGINGFWDFGPLGVELKNNIKLMWWKAMVQNREDVVGLDSSIIHNPKTWVASGHVQNFTDPMVDCRVCKQRFRADQLAEEQGIGMDEIMTKGQMFDLRQQRVHRAESFQSDVPDACRTGCGRCFGGLSASGNLPGDIFINFDNVRQSTRVKLPFGIAQIGKAFRNEVNPRNFIFRSREFEQMEMEWFCYPPEAEGQKMPEEWHEYWKQKRFEWHLAMGLKKENIRFRDHRPG
jgi:glycyl-tRNA synthetase